MSVQVADICWALGTTRHWSGHLPFLEEEAERLIQASLQPAGLAGKRYSSSRSSSSQQSSGSSSMNCAQVANVAWGLAVLGHAPLGLLGLLPCLLERWEQADGYASSSEGPQPGAARGQQLGFSGLCALAWSIAVAGQVQHEVCISVLAALALSAPRGSGGGAGGGSAAAGGPSRKQLMQLHQVALALEGAGAPGGWPDRLAGGGQLPPSAAAELQQLFANAAAAAQGLAADRRAQQVRILFPLLHGLHSVCGVCKQGC